MPIDFKKDGNEWVTDPTYAPSSDMYMGTNETDLDWLQSSMAVAIHVPQLLKYNATTDFASVACDLKIS